LKKISSLVKISAICISPQFIINMMNSKKGRAETLPFITLFNYYSGKDAPVG